jgi:hypothetical protein
MAEQKAAPALKTHFVVARTNWRVVGESGAFVRLPGETRVAAFANASHAEADRATREAEARRLVNPFRCGVLWSERSHLPEPVFRDFIKDTGVEPPVLVPLPRVDEKGLPIGPYDRRQLEQERPVPPGAFRDWAAWWDATAPALSAEQVARVWEGLDRIRFFRTEERPVRAVAFAVVRIDWNYNDMWYYPGDDGGETVVAYRTRERAEAECARQNAEAREQWRRDLGLARSEEVTDPDRDPQSLYQFDMQHRPFPGRSSLEPQLEPPPRAQKDPEKLFTVDEVPFFEVVEIEVAEGK